MHNRRHYQDTTFETHLWIVTPNYRKPDFNNFMKCLFKGSSHNQSSEYKYRSMYWGILGAFIFWKIPFLTHNIPYIFLQILHCDLVSIIFFFFYFSTYNFFPYCCSWRFAPLIRGTKGKGTENARIILG